VGGFQLSNENNHCQFCGSVITEDDEFCGNCGANLGIVLLTEEKKQEIIDLIKNQSKMRISLVSTITGTLEEDIRNNAGFMGLEIQDIYLVNPKPITFTQSEVKLEKPVPRQYKTKALKQYDPGPGAAAILSLLFTIGTLILYSIPCILFNIVGGIAALIAIFLGIIGAAVNKGRKLAIGCIIVCVLLTIASIVARTIITGW